MTYKKKCRPLSANEKIFFEIYLLGKPRGDSNSQPRFIVILIKILYSENKPILENILCNLYSSNGRYSAIVNPIIPVFSWIYCSISESFSIVIFPPPTPSPTNSGLAKYVEWKQCSSKNSVDNHADLVSQHKVFHFPLLFPLCYIVPPVFMNSDKGKY